MYSCKDSIHALLDFLDGDMSPEDQRVLEEHLNGCPPCVAFVRSYRATSGLCRRALGAKMPEELAEKLKGFLRAKLQKR
jgi:anti-sigma factor (TIGR02949 family)